MEVIAEVPGDNLPAHYEHYLLMAIQNTTAYINSYTRKFMMQPYTHNEHVPSRPSECQITAHDQGSAITRILEAIRLYQYTMTLRRKLVLQE